MAAYVSKMKAWCWDKDESAWWGETNMQKSFIVFLYVDINFVDKRLVVHSLVFYILIQEKVMTTASGVLSHSTREKVTGQNNSWLCPHSSLLLCWHGQTHQPREEAPAPGNEYRWTETGSSSSHAWMFLCDILWSNTNTCWSTVFTTPPPPTVNNSTESFFSFSFYTVKGEPLWKNNNKLLVMMCIFSVFTAV